MKRFDRNVMFLGALAFVLVAAMLVLAFAISSPVEAGGGGGYCNPLYLRLGGCQPRVTCDIGTPQVNGSQETGYYLECYYPPTAPVNDGDPLVIDLGVGQLAHVLCETRLHFDLFNGEQGLEVLCEE